jgi:hypothetical protein
MPQYYKELLMLAFKFYYIGCVTALVIFVVRILTDKKFLNGMVDILKPIKDRPGISIVVLYGIVRMVLRSWISVAIYLSKITFKEGDND